LTFLFIVVSRVRQIGEWGNPTAFIHSIMGMIGLASNLSFLYSLNQKQNQNQVLILEV